VAEALEGSYEQETAAVEENEEIGDGTRGCDEGCWRSGQTSTS
jgi:hypothetical protein